MTDELWDELDTDPWTAVEGAGFDVIDLSFLYLALRLALAREDLDVVTRAEFQRLYDRVRRETAG